MLLALVFAACTADPSDPCAWGAEQGDALGAECLPGSVVVVCSSEQGEAWEQECAACALDAYLTAYEGCPPEA